MNIQSSINQAIGSLGYMGKLTRGYIERQQLANKKAEQIAQAKKTQRRNFKRDYLSKMQSNIGLIGDLPQNLQNAIAKTYSKSDRAKIMNKMDARKL